MILTLLSWVYACTLSLWKVITCLHTESLPSQLVWEGIWMSCVVQGTGQRYCKVDVSMAGTAPRSCRLPTSLCITVFTTDLLSLFNYLLGTGIIPL